LVEPVYEKGDSDDPREEPPDVELEPPRELADPDLPLEDDEGVREPAGVW
jgi:hypothetical protein